MNRELKQALGHWFSAPGAYVLVDGQYGSTGKGLIAGALAECFWDRVEVAISNAGPNSGHTSYFNFDPVQDGQGMETKVVLKQLPTFSVIARLASHYTDRVHTYLSGGAVIDEEILKREITLYDIRNFSIHPCAALLRPDHREKDAANVKHIASTGQGVGPAIGDKIARYTGSIFNRCDQVRPFFFNFHYSVCFMEIPQGFSLGINSGFYPHVTSRECSVSQALADAGMPPSFHKKTLMVVRTFPIRVGSTENSSGPCYPDQNEIGWEQLKVEPEFTTVTHRQRRVFTWSASQYRDALMVLNPNVVALTFCDYLRPDEVNVFVGKNVYLPYVRLLGREPEAILLSFGPRSFDIQIWRG